MGGANGMSMEMVTSNSPLRFERHANMPLTCDSNWRYLVVADVTGVHVLDFLPPVAPERAGRGRRGGGASISGKAIATMK